MPAAGAHSQFESVGCKRNSAWPSSFFFEAFTSITVSGEDDKWYSVAQFPVVDLFKLLPQAHWQWRAQVSVDLPGLNRQSRTSYLFSRMTSATPT
jgi:hypothetical protein